MRNWLLKNDRILQNWPTQLQRPKHVSTHGKIETAQLLKPSYKRKNPCHGQCPLTRTDTSNLQILYQMLCLLQYIYVRVPSLLTFVGKFRWYGDFELKKCAYCKIYIWKGNLTKFKVYWARYNSKHKFGIRVRELGHIISYL